MKKPFVSIVVASYNRKYIINESIQSILSQNYPEDSFEVIVVDNNSNDGTVSEIKKIFSREIDNKKIKLLDLKLNSGSSGSYIEALKVIREDWKYMLKMDEDVVLDKDCVAELVNEAEKSEKHTFVGGKVFYFQNKDTLHAIGADLKPYYAIAKGIGVNETNHEKFSEARTLDALNGCMVLISRKIEKEIGWFDKDYFLYYADHDLMYRSIKAKNIQWPEYDVSMLKEDTINIVVQINGKKRGLIQTKPNITEEKLFKIIGNDEKIMKYFDQKNIKKRIYIKDKLLNIII